MHDFIQSHSVASPSFIFYSCHLLCIISMPFSYSVIEMYGGISFISVRWCCTICDIEIKLSKQVVFTFHSIHFYLTFADLPHSFLWYHIFCTALSYPQVQSFIIFFLLPSNNLLSLLPNPFLCPLFSCVYTTIFILQFSISNPNSNLYVKYNWWLKLDGFTICANFRYLDKKKIGVC